MANPFKTGLIAAAAILSLSAGAQAVERMIDLRDIKTALVPLDHFSGDREFGGNGPLMTVNTQLAVIQNGRAIVAMISFEAVETGGDRSAVRGSFNKVVWRTRGGERVMRILSNASETVRKRSAPGRDPNRPYPVGGAPVEDGGHLNALISNTGGFLNAVYAVGDTTGDDISTDSNPHGDTSIRYIDFGRLRVDMNQ